MRRVLLSNSQILTKRNTVKMPGRFKETSPAHQGQGVGTGRAEDRRAWETDWEKHTEAIYFCPKGWQPLEPHKIKRNLKVAMSGESLVLYGPTKGGATRAEGTAASECRVWPWCGNGETWASRCGQPLHFSGKDNMSFPGLSRCAFWALQAE